MTRPRIAFHVWRGIVLAVAFVAFPAGQAVGAPPTGATDPIVVDVGRPGAEVPATLFGLFFEDINFGADGGLYPERVINRGFEFTEPLHGWRKPFRPEIDGELLVMTSGGLHANTPHYLRMRARSPGLSVVNPGFRGMGVEAGAEYVLSAYVRARPDGPRSLKARLRDGEKTVAEADLTGFAGEWKKHEAVLRPTATSPRAQLEVVVEGTGDVDIDMVSLYPRQTFKDRQNGLRKDVAQLLADMKPGFLRFPGGCIVEGRRLAQRYDWKKTVGDLLERIPLVNRWNDEFAHRPAPDYYQSFGLGFFEYFQLAEDIGAAPLPILNCGMACQFNSGETVALEDLAPFIQDALDLVEFANGPVDSRWGRLRASMGHPAPFGLAMIGVGNEQWGPRYVERYERFAAALKKAHPEIALVASAGPSPAGPMFDFLWGEMRRLRAEVVDEHYYSAPAWFLANASRYDGYDRRGPKVFAGEYAAQTSGVARPDNRNNWEAALAEAAFMTGLERNADVVSMASYAPLLAHVDAWQWTPNLIWFDNLRSFGTPSYYVQKAYATNLGTHLVPLTVGGSAKNAENGLYTSASIDRRSSEVILKAVNASPSARAVRVDLAGGAAMRGDGRLLTLHSADPKAENTLDQPTRVAPVDSVVMPSGKGFDLTLPPGSMTVLRAKFAR